MAKKPMRKSAAAPHRREQLIVGKPPRMPPLVGDEVTKSAMILTARLRKAALPGAPPLAVSEMPEIMTTLMCHPDLWERVALLSIQLLGHGALARRDAELAILRTAWLCQAPYEWGEHVVQGKNAGVTAKEIGRIIAGSSARGWSAHDRAILRAVEELHDDAMITDATWRRLAKRLDHKQLFELLVLIGQFTSVAYFQNAVRLRLPAKNLGLSAR
jgi:alkylhydroperoxidase family enzyme